MRGKLINNTNPERTGSVDKSHGILLLLPFRIIKNLYLYSLLHGAALCFKKKSRPVSRVLSLFHCSAREGGKGFYHFSGPGVTTGLMRPTPRHRTGSPYTPVYMVLQPLRWTARNVTTASGGLLPHLLTIAILRPS